MIRQCAWCLKMMGESPPLKDKSVTHGMCEECMEKAMKEVQSIKQEPKR